MTWHTAHYADEGHDADGCDLCREGAKSLAIRARSAGRSAAEQSLSEAAVWMRARHPRLALHLLVLSTIAEGATP